MVPILSVEGLSYDYGERRALDDLTFALPAGRFCALLGPNGAGKSTLFSLLTRLRVAPKGTINVDGQSLVTHPRHALAKIGVVFQQMTLDLDLSVERNLFYFAALHGLPKSLAASRIEDALERTWPSAVMSGRVILMAGTGGAWKSPARLSIGPSCSYSMSPPSA